MFLSFYGLRFNNQSVLPIYQLYTDEAALMKILRVPQIFLLHSCRTGVGNSLGSTGHIRNK
jgi:hypothetical protein